MKMAFLARIMATSCLAWMVLSAAVKEPIQARAVGEPKCNEQFGFPVLTACALAYRDDMLIRQGDDTSSRVFRISDFPLTNNDVWTPQEYQHFKIRMA